MNSLKTIGMACVFAATLLAADNSFEGTWKLEVEKSVFAPGEEMKDMTVTFKQEGDKIRRTAVGTYSNGKPLDEGPPEGISFAWDGKPHVVREAPRVIITCTPIRNRVTHVTIEINGKLASKIAAQVSADGNTLTQTGDDYDQQGKPHAEKLVFTRQ